MNKKMKEKQNEIDVLKDMVVSIKTELRTKEINIKKQQKRIDALEKINGLRGNRNPQLSDA
jgi:hypothetical protein